MPVIVRHPRALFAATTLVAAILVGCGGDSSGDPVAAAKASLEKGDVPTAIVQLKSALQKSSRNGEARYLLGTALLRMGDANAAAVELEKAHEAGQADDDVVPELARVMLELGQTKKLIERFADTTLARPASIADLKASLAVALWQQKNMVGAKAAVSDALAAVPTHGPATLLQANLKAADGDIDGALSDTRSILSRNPKDLQAQQFLGVLLLHGKRDPKAAMEAFSKAVEIEPRFPPAHKALVTLHLQNRDIAGAKQQYEALKKALPNHSQTLHTAALLAYMQEDYPAAREAVQKLLRVADQSAPLQFLAGMIEYQAGAMLQAETFLSKGLQLHPDSSFARRLLAHVYIRTGQSERALATLKPLLAADAVEAETLATAAEIQLLMGNVSSAETYYGAAAKMAPDNRRARTAVALMKVTKGDKESGFAELESLSKGDADSYVDLALVTARLRLKDFDGALRAVDALQAKQPKKPFPLMLKSRILEAKQDAVGAKASLEAAYAIDPGYLPAAGRLADYDLLDNKPDQAAKRFDAVLKADPKNSAALLAVAEVRRVQGAKADELSSLYAGVIRANPDEARARVLLVNHELRQGNVKAALDAAQSAVAALPNNPQVLLALGDALIKAGDLQQALSAFSRLSSQQPKAPYPHFRMAEVHMMANNRASALKALARSLELAPNYLPSQRALVAIHTRSGEFDQAGKLIRSIQSQRPKEDIGFLLDGDFEVARKRWDAAAKSYRAALALGKSSESAMKLHKVLILGGKKGEADQFAATWTKQQTTDAAFVMYLGDIALSSSQWPVAESHYREAVRIDPRRASAWNNLAHVLMAQKRPGALEMAEKANQLSPGRPAMMDTLALALAADGKFEQALETQRKVVGLAADTPVYQLTLAKIYLQAGDKTRAKAELDKLARLTDDFPGKSDVAKLLSTL